MSDFDFSTYNVKVNGRIASPIPMLKNPKKNPREQVLARFEEGVTRSSFALRLEVEARLENAIRSSSWNWPRQTQRKNGRVAGGTRNIVDLGSLLLSQETKLRSSKNKYSIKMVNSAPHAKITYYGGYIVPYGNPNAGATYIPGRPWVEAIFKGTHGQPKLNLRSFLAPYFVD